jgi:DNA polymerase III epsilon subunit-like protein
MKILVFDTETNDKPPLMKNGKWFTDKRLLSKPNFKKKNGGLWSEMLDKWPHIIQLAYILYDTENPANSKIFNKYIDISDSVKITEETEAIHHITKEKIERLSKNKKGTISNVLTEFLEDVKEADIIVGHNVDFDRTMIVAEVLRMKSNAELDLLLNIMFDDTKFECTQKITKPICKLLNPSKTGKYKVPKLIEAYEHFFGYKPCPEMLHDAIIDVVICLRVYCMSFKKCNPFERCKCNPFDIFNTNKKITNYINKITPLNKRNFLKGTIKNKKSKKSKKGISRKIKNKK